MLENRRIVLGVGGGVAAYKAAYLARRLVERGADVHAVFTAAAEKFLGAQTMASITGRNPHAKLFGSSTPSPHTELARWAEAIVIAPATAHTIAKLAGGLASDLLSATALASTAPLVLAPAMHTEMWEHPATVRNIETLKGFGYTIVEPEAGELAGGDVGLGRLAEPERIVDAVEALFSNRPLAGQKVVVSAGGTREPLDPVRYLGNRSSGKMGAAIAGVAAQLGADVVLVTTTHIHPNGVEVIAVETAQDMAEAVWSESKDAGVVVLAAAVADFRPVEASATKVRRADGVPNVALEATPDILAGVAKMEPRPFLVGFAAETGPVEGAVAKAQGKGVDLLVANDVTEPGSGFGTDTNRVAFITPDGELDHLDSMPKHDVAQRLWRRIMELRGAS